MTGSFLWVWSKLLSEASNDRLLIHYGDVLEFDIESSCKDYITPVAWEDGEIFDSICHYCCDNTMEIFCFQIFQACLF